MITPPPVSSSSSILLPPSFSQRKIRLSSPDCNYISCFYFFLHCLTPWSSVLPEKLTYPKVCLQMLSKLFSSLVDETCVCTDILCVSLQCVRENYKNTSRLSVRIFTVRYKMSLYCTSCVTSNVSTVINNPSFTWIIERIVTWRISLQCVEYSDMYVIKTFDSRTKGVKTVDFQIILGMQWLSY